MPFSQGAILWFDASFAEEHLDLVKELSEGLAQGLPDMEPLR